MAGTLTLHLLLLLLLLLLTGSHASHYYGTVMTFTPKDSGDDGSVRVVFHYKLSFRSCSDEDSWDCVSGDCGTQSVELNVVDNQDVEWCQSEGVMTRRVSTNAPFQLQMDGGDWISVKNGISSWRAMTHVDLRARSDTAEPNRSPQTTILPALRVPSNCPRIFSLLAFDADGDEVKCRFGSTEAEECNPCLPPSVLTISPACTMTFHSTGIGNEGPYAVQLEMEDFPKDTITLLQSDGEETTRTPSDALSKIPLRFAFIVDPAVPSCTEGHYLPRFLLPTPVNGVRLYAFINETLEINITADTANSVISKLLLSGPHGVVNQPRGSGQFTLSWTPSDVEDGEDHPICFVVEAVNNPTTYHSDLRCVIVSVGLRPTTTTLPTTSTVLPTTALQTTADTTLAPTTEADVLRNRAVLPDVQAVERSGGGKLAGVEFSVGSFAMLLALRYGL